MGGQETSGRSRSDRRVSPPNRARLVAPARAVEEATLADLEEQMHSASRVESQAAALRSRLAAEYRRRAGRRNAEKALREASGRSMRAARSEVETARRLEDLPRTRRAFDRGEIAPGHVRIIARTAARVDIDEVELVDRARREPVDVFARNARRYEQRRSEDDGLSRLEAQKRSRRAWIGTDRDDGMTVLYARFDPVTGAWVKNALSTRTGLLWREEDRDRPRSTEQRMADALADLICRPDRQTGEGEAGGDGSRWGGATLFIMADYDVVTRRLGNAALADGTPLPIEEVKQMACRAGIVPAFFNGKGRPLWVGRSKRLATRSQRMALVARYRRCVGCGADPDWCEAHHIIPWRAEGRTDMDNLVLVCRGCHNQIHDDGWRIRETPTGRYAMVPPTRTNRPPPPVRAPRSGRRRRNRKRTTELRR